MYWLVGTMGGGRGRVVPPVYGSTSWLRARHMNSKSKNSKSIINSCFTNISSDSTNSSSNSSIESLM